MGEQLVQVVANSALEYVVRWELTGIVNGIVSDIYINFVVRSNPMDRLKKACP